MQVTKKKVSDTKVLLTINAGQAYLAPIKQQTLSRLASQVKLPGFREGKAPLSLVEKHVDPQVLQGEFFEEAMNSLYPAVLESENIRPLDRPNVTLKKFVPFTEIEVDLDIDVLGPVKLADYKKFKATKTKVSVSEKDINDVINNLKKRVAEKKEVTRASKDGDQVWIDFTGVNEKKELIKGAEGKDYPLLLGSKTFIPGFEDNLLGLKAGDKKTFTLTFPKDYQVKALANKKITFNIAVKKVEEVIASKVDDAFAKKVGSFKNVAELTSDIKKQLTAEREQQAASDVELNLINQLTEKSKVTVPELFINDQIERDLRELKQNLSYRGQTFQEYLEAEGKSEDELKKDVMKPNAERKVKTSLLLAEVSEVEKLNVTPEELEIRMQILKQQYKDPAIQVELDKPETRRDIASRILTEKTIRKLVDYAT